MTIQLAKDQAAKEFGYKDFWDGFLQRYNPSLKHTITDLINRSLEIYAESKAKEAYNQGVRDAAESAMMKFHDGFHKENKDIDYFMSGQDNLTVSKQSILKLLK